MRLVLAQDGMGFGQPFVLSASVSTLPYWLRARTMAHCWALRSRRMLPCAQAERAAMAAGAAGQCAGHPRNEPRPGDLAHP